MLPGRSCNQPCGVLMSRLFVGWNPASSSEAGWAQVEGRGHRGEYIRNCFLGKAGLTTQTLTSNESSCTLLIIHVTSVMRCNCRPGFGINNTGLKRRNLDLRLYAPPMFTRGLGLPEDSGEVQSAPAGYPPKGNRTTWLPPINRASIVSFSIRCYFLRALAFHSKFSDTIEGLSRSLQIYPPAIRVP